MDVRRHAHEEGVQPLVRDEASAVRVDGGTQGLRGGTGSLGVYVADGSLLPTALGVNPMITIIAMARRIARGLADQLVV